MINKKFLLTLFTTILLINIYACLIPSVQAAEPTTEQKVTTITNSVIGVDLNKYSAISEHSQNLYLDAVPQENTRYTLETQESKLDLYYTFINGNLQKIHVLEAQGKPQMQKNQPLSAREQAQDLLNSYSQYSKNSFYENLASMLTDVPDSKNTTLTSGNIKLSVTAQADSTTYRWVYVFDGFEAGDKCVALNFADGFLKYFINNWDLYTIGSASVNVSEQQAIDSAMAKAMEFTWATVLDNKTVEGLKYNVTNAMVLSSCFSNSLFMDNYRDKDPLVLYPMYYVWVSFDKFYPGNVYGMTVCVWADTGEIGHVQERFSTVDPPADLIASEDDIAKASTDYPSNNGIQSKMFLLTWVLVPALSIILTGLLLVFLNKKEPLSASKLFRFAPLRLGGLILCVLIASTVFTELSVSTVNALPSIGRTTIWGSESRGAWNDTLNPPDGSSWRKHYTEVARQQDTAAFLQTKFALNGYYASDYQGSKGSDKASILTQIQNNGQNYARVAVVVFDHGNGNNETNIMGAPDSEFHYLFEDQTGTRLGGTFPGTEAVGNGVYDMEIYNRVGSGSYFFVLINACNSAHIEDTMGAPPNQQTTTQGLISGRARGMPFAWSHRLVENRDIQGFNIAYHMSDDGYARPDTGSFVYLGFHLGSAALTQVVVAQNSSMYPYWWWLEHFFAYALNDNWTVKQALDEASQQIYGDDFGLIRLYTGYQSIWPMYRYDQWYYDSSGEFESKMRVYGNSDLKLYQPTLTLNAYDNNNNQLGPTFSIDGNSHGSGSTNVYSGSHSVSVSDIPGYTFQYFTYNGQTYYSRPVTLSITADRTITAHYQYQPPRYLTISSNGGGSTNPALGVHQYVNGQTATVTAAPASLTGKVLYNWLLDENSIGNALSVDVPMYGDHTLSANFSDAPSPLYPYANAHIYSGPTNYVGSVWSLTGFQPDGHCAGLGSIAPYGVHGTIAASLNAAATGHVNVYGSGGLLLVEVSSTGADGSWTSLGSHTLGSSAQWVDCGISWSSFSYVRLVADGDGDNLSIDSVRVTPAVNYTLTASAGAHGSVNTTSGSYVEGTNVVVNATADSGYGFLNWVLDDQNYTSNPITVSMTQNHTLTAHFYQLPVYYYLTVQTYANGIGEISTTIFVDDINVGNSPVTVPVTGGYHSVYSEPYSFAYWYFVGVFDPETQTVFNGYVNHNMTVIAGYDYGSG